MVNPAPGMALTKQDPINDARFSSTSAPIKEAQSHGDFPDAGLAACPFLGSGKLL
jgi:hypothetical protein